MSERLASVAAFACAATAVFAVSAGAHFNGASGGGGNDTMDGHEHFDWFDGNSGCDELLGRGDPDHLEGGPSGCDKVRGMENGDDVIVWDDGAGGDEAYGGAGINDRCYVGHQDSYDKSSCELTFFP